MNLCVDRTEDTENYKITLIFTFFKKFLIKLDLHYNYKLFSVRKLNSLVIEYLIFLLDTDTKKKNRSFKS